MTGKEFTKAVTVEANKVLKETGKSVTEGVVGEVIKAEVTVASNALKNNDTIQISGFGTFKVSKRDARTGRNPQTGEAIQIAAKRVPKFSAAKALKDILA